MNVHQQQARPLVREVDSTTDHFRRCIALFPAANATSKLTYEALHPTAYSAAVSLVPRFTLALPTAAEFMR